MVQCGHAPHLRVEDGHDAALGVDYGIGMTGHFDVRI